MSKQKVLIIGGGFGGTFSARYLQRLAADRFTIELISDYNYFVFQPLLPEVASGTINAQDAVTPLRVLLPGVKFRMAEVRGVDFEAKEVLLVQGLKRTLHRLPYDHLVLAPGQITDLSLFPGFDQHSLTMKNLSDAYVLRNHMIECMELADVTDNAELRRALLTFVVAGGGFSGVETAGELAEMIRRTRKYYPSIKQHDVRLVLIQRGSAILPEMPAKLGDYAAQRLQKRGIEIWTNTSIASASARQVRTECGKAIDTMTIITTLGNGPAPFVKTLGLPLQRGKIATDRMLRVAGVDNVWALGDSALVPLGDDNKTFAPPTAQFTVRQAKTLARNIAAVGDGAALQAFEYDARGMLASLGNYQGVASVMGLSISGLPAWWLWRAFYIAMLPGFATRMRVALNWLFDYFMPRTIVEMHFEQQPAARYISFSRGDVVIEQGQLLDGFYLVISGELEMRVEIEGEADFVKHFKSGDHWGERIIQRDALCSGRISALQDSVVLLLQKDDFKRLRSAFKPMDEYLNSIDDTHYSKFVRQID